MTWLFIRRFRLRVTILWLEIRQAFVRGQLTYWQEALARHERKQEAGEP